MELIFLIIILICLFVALIFGAITSIALGFKYLVSSLIAYVLIVGVWTWIKLGYDFKKNGYIIKCIIVMGHIKFKSL